MWRFAGCAALVAAVAGCAPAAPRLQLAYRTDADCESRAVKQTAINAIIASTDDTVRDTKPPPDAALRRMVMGGGGVFAYWHDQPFRAPDTAKALGLSGDLTLRRAVITNDVNAAEHWRPVWMTFATPRGPVTVLERAYDIQNVCIEGRRDI